MLINAQRALMAAAAVAFAGVACAAPPTPVYLTRAAASDLYEKQSSRAVLATTRDPDVRRFATMMVRDHNQSTVRLRNTALRVGAHPKPPALNGMQRRMMADLSRSRGRERDRLYIDQQRQAHQMALDLHQDYASTGDNRALRRVAGEIVPVVQHHIDMLRDLR